MTEQEIAGEINGYKQQLEQSDYKVMKAVERIFSASSITDLALGHRRSCQGGGRDHLAAPDVARPHQRAGSHGARPAGSAAGVASAPSGALFFCPATPRGQSRQRFEEVRKRMTDVLEIFAPYGPGSLFGALLVLVVLYFGKQFLEEFKAQNERKANIDLKCEERKQDEVNERAQRDRERSQMEGRIAAQMERSNALMEP